MPTTAPSLRFERTFLAHGHRYLAGCDEVGRGALAGPVSVGLVVIDLTRVRSLTGVRDSKLLSAANRNLLVPKIQKWAVAHAVGHGEAAEIDAYGLMAALRLAGNRAWRQVCTTVRPDAVILDGNYNWLSSLEDVPLFEEAVPERGCDAPVHTKIKADLKCTSVAAASVLAKVERDALMVRLAHEHPAYGWDINKGYATEVHRAAIDRVGVCADHRQSWRLGTDTRALAPAVNTLASGGMMGV